MKLAVIDTSVIVSSLTREESSERADTVLLDSRAGRVLMAVPDFQPVEVANALRRKVERGLFDERKAFELLERYRSLETFVEKPDLNFGLTVAVRYGHSVYDCLYLELAERFRCDLITADTRFWRKLGGEFPRIRLI